VESIIGYPSVLFFFFCFFRQTRMETLQKSFLHVSTVKQESDASTRSRLVQHPRSDYRDIGNGTSKKVPFRENGDSSGIK